MQVKALDVLRHFHWIVRLLLALLFVTGGQVGSSHATSRTATHLSAERSQCGRLCLGQLSRLSARQLDRVLAHLQRTMTHPQRLLVLSEMFLGTRYRLGPLGEGPKGRWDRDPIWRLDRVDCVTYVESVMAMALSTSLQQAKQKLQRIRYKRGVIRFDHRNHFTAAQWLPVNQRAGYLRPITRQIAGTHAVALRRRITADIWRKKQWRWWQRRLPAAHRPTSYTIWYVPLRQIPKVLERLPAIAWMGEIFDSAHNPVSVRHVGFAVRKRGQVLFRHANRPRVAEISLTRYAKLHMAKARRGRSRVIGFSFATLTPPKPLVDASRR